MSEEQKSDAQAETPKAEEPQEPEETLEVEPKEEAEEELGDDLDDDLDIADEEELDIEIERVAPKKSRGCGPIGWVIFIILLAAAAVLVHMKIQQDREAAEQREAREVQYLAQEKTIRDNIKSAATIAQKGDIDAAFKELVAAEKKWGDMAAGANSNKDMTKAQYAMMLQSQLQKAIKNLQTYRDKAQQYDDEAEELKRQAKELAAKRDELNNYVKEQLLELSAAGASPTAGTKPGPALDEDKPAADAEKPAEEATDAEKVKNAEDTGDAKDAEDTGDIKDAKDTEKPKTRDVKKKSVKSSKESDEPSKT